MFIYLLHYWLDCIPKDILAQNQYCQTTHLKRLFDVQHHKEKTNLISDYHKRHVDFVRYSLELESEPIFPLHFNQPEESTVDFSFFI